MIDDPSGPWCGMPWSRVVDHPDTAEIDRRYFTDHRVRMWPLERLICAEVG